MARVGKIDEALGQVGIVGGERRFDFARGHRGIEFPVERAFGDARRIVGDGERGARLEPARHRIDRERGQQGRHQQRGSDARTKHDESILRAQPGSAIAQSHGGSAPLGDNPV